MRLSEPKKVTNRTLRTLSFVIAAVVWVASILAFVLTAGCNGNSDSPTVLRPTTETITVRGAESFCDRTPDHPWCDEGDQ